MKLDGAVIISQDSAARMDCFLKICASKFKDPKDFFVLVVKYDLSEVFDDFREANRDSSLN